MSTLETRRLGAPLREATTTSPQSRGKIRAPLILKKFEPAAWLEFLPPQTDSDAACGSSDRGTSEEAFPRTPTTNKERILTPNFITKRPPFKAVFYFKTRLYLFYRTGTRGEVPRIPRGARPQHLILNERLNTKTAPYCLFSYFHHNPFGASL